MNNPRISQLLVETKAFKDLDKPVILTSGELGIYYINTEKLAQDNGEFEKFGDNSLAMIQHAVRMTKEHPTFGEVIDILANDARKLLPNFSRNNEYGISGGQRRDWLFSGPVADKLQIPHISLYKDGKLEIVAPSGETYGLEALGGRRFQTLHFVDLLTEASSCYRLEGEEPAGWIPMLGGNNFPINNLVTVVSRLQGGEERLKQQGVNVEAKVAIDADFLKNYSKQPEIAVLYNQNPTAWSQDYLRTNGALLFAADFDPAGKKLDRAKKFLTRYRSILEEAGRLQELDLAVKDKYNKPLDELIGVKA